MKKIILAAMAAVLTAGAANAQSISFGPEIGLNLASYSGKVLGTSMHTGMKIGARVGAVADIGITDNIFVRPGIQFSMMGGKGGDLPSGASVSINYIQVPVNILYKLGEEGDGRIYFGLVPYIGYAIGAKEKDDNNSEDLKIGTKEGEDDIKPLDFGAGIKVGYEFPMGLCVDAAFLQGLSNNVPGGNSDLKTSNRLITIGGSWFFGR